MKSRSRALLRLLFLLSVILSVVSHHDMSFSQPTLSAVMQQPQESILIRISLTNGMLNKNYFYGVYYTTTGVFDLQMVFYDRGTERIMLLNEYPGRMGQVDHNEFYVMGPWSQLERAGDYLIAFIPYKAPAPAQEIIETLKLSSNTREAIADRYTLVANRSIGVATQRGSNGFQIRYELNKTSNMKHEIERTEDNQVVFKEDKDDVPKGTRGFEWMAQNAKGNCWYRAIVQAVPVEDKDKWDHDTSRRFQKIK